MFSGRSLQAVLVVWTLWHLVFGLLATLAPETGGQITGWAPQASWSDDLVAMKIHGVSTKFAERIKEKMGDALTADTLVEMMIHGVPEGAW